MESMTWMSLPSLLDLSHGPQVLRLVFWMRGYFDCLATLLHIYLNNLKECNIALVTIPDTGSVDSQCLVLSIAVSWEVSMVCLSLSLLLEILMCLAVYLSSPCTIKYLVELRCDTYTYTVSFIDKEEGNDITKEEWWREQQLVSLASDHLPKKIFPNEYRTIFVPIYEECLHA